MLKDKTPLGAVNQIVNISLNPPLMSSTNHLTDDGKPGAVVYSIFKEDSLVLKTYGEKKVCMNIYICVVIFSACRS